MKTKQSSPAEATTTSEPSSEAPKSPTEALTQLIWKLPPTLRWLAVAFALLVPAIIAIPKETLATLAQVFSSETLPESGVRVVDRTSILDLTGFQETTDDQIRTKDARSVAVSRNEFHVVRSTSRRTEFIHTYSTTSKIDPKVTWVDPRYTYRIVSDPETRANGLRAWHILFNIEKEPVEEEFTIRFNVTFYNAFQTTDQEWGGFRVLHDTEHAKYIVIFPRDKSAKREGLEFYYVTDEAQKIQKRCDAKCLDLKDCDPKCGDFAVTPINGNPIYYISQLEWNVQNPHPDRSYRVHWKW
jgi:hypothetical protein